MVCAIATQPFLSRRQVAPAMSYQPEGDGPTARPDAARVPATVAGPTPLAPGRQWSCRPPPPDTTAALTKLLLYGQTKTDVANRGGHETVWSSTTGNRAGPSNVL